MGATGDGLSDGGSAGAGAGALRGLRSPRGRAGPSVYGIGHRRSKIQRIPPLDDGVSPAPLAAAGTTRQCNVVCLAAGRWGPGGGPVGWARDRVTTCAMPVGPVANK